MWGLDRIATVLLAASTAPGKDSTKLKSVQDISQSFRELYTVLGEKAPVFRQESPTIRFSYVTPPSEGQKWDDENVLYSDATLLDSLKDEDLTIFERVAKTHGSKKPLAIYLPGLDGFGVSAATWQFNDLSNFFELWRLSVSVEDRTSFGDLVKTVCTFVEDAAANTDRPIYLIAESFGGLLAPAVALRFQKQAERAGGTSESPLKGMVLVNPATSFDESNWDVLAPALSSFGDVTDNIPMPFGLPSPYSIVGGLTLASLIPSSDQFQRILDTMLSLESATDPSGALDSMRGSLESFKITADVLPPEILEHRIKNWMIVGATLVKPRLEQLQLPTLVVVGTDDKLIDSGREVGRLMKTLPNCEKLEVRGAGHFVLDDSVNLTEAILYSKLDPLDFKNTVKPYDPILDWELPPKEVVDKVYEENVKFLDDAFSPVYISTDHDGNKAFGLENLPREGPLLFVANHQLLGLDLNFLISKFLDTGLTVRGLAHPIVFQQSTRRGDLGGRTPGLQPSSRGGQGPSTTNFEQFGAVMVTPRNYYRLLQSGQNALLFPGGVREVFHGRDEAYQLFWPSKIDFVRTAAKFNATIIPISAVGMADSLNMVLEPSELADLPFLGERATEFAKNVTSARFDMENEEENFLPPIVAPGLPSRNYFLFGKPIETSSLDQKDKEACESVYQSLQDDMNAGFSAILEAREKDQYKEAIPRLAYERISGKKAPTFELEDLDLATKKF